MITWLFKPFGYDNYLVITQQEELAKLFETFVPGDEYILKVAELSEEEFAGLENFTGYSSPSGVEENMESEEPTETAEPQE